MKVISLTIMLGVILVSLMANTYGHSMGFSIYTNTTTLLPLFKTYYANATSNDLLIDDAWAPKEEAYVGYWNTPQAFPRMIIANNVSALASLETPEAKQFNFGPNDYIDYDSEDWSLTPVAEQKAIVFYTQQACNSVHLAGYKFAFSPEVDVRGWYSLTNWASFNWTCMQFLDLQEQANSQNTSTLTNNVTDLISIAKGDNPNLIVFVQLDSSVGEAITDNDIAALANITGVNGVIVQDLCSTNNCNTSLTAEINYIKSLGSSSPFSSTTSSSSTTSTSTSISTTTLLTSTSTITNHRQTSTTTIPGHRGRRTSFATIAPIVTVGVPIAIALMVGYAIGRVHATVTKKKKPKRKK